MTWTDYNLIVLLCCILWLKGIILLIPKEKLFTGLSQVFLISGTILLAFFMAGLWISLERPLFRTLAETRLWYSLFLSVIGIVIYYRWKYKWMPVYCTLMAMLFLMINYFRPDTFDKTLMPALQSPWFIPHVVVYMVSYAFMAAAWIIGIAGLNKLYRKKPTENILRIADNIVYVGFAFLTFGMLFGALWAKVAWGTYWSWDPKETWALLSWLFYLLYIHIRIDKNTNPSFSLWILALSFIILLIC
ncbi:MAG: cytochrome c biogenesis protein CcsA, partial [Bacteroidales bacterium]